MSLILLVWDLGGKTIACRKKRFLPLDNKWYGNCKKRGHYRLMFFINFAHRVKARNNICLVYTKFNAFICTLIWLQVIAFCGGPIALHGLVHFLNTIGPSLTKVVYAYFDCISYGPYPFSKLEGVGLLNTSIRCIVVTPPFSGI